MSDICECVDFGEGDWVECKLDTNLFGIIISSSDWGRYYTVQLAGSTDTRLFHWATIRHCPELDEQGGGAAEPVPGGSNVIYADFGPHTKTKGAA